MARKGSGWHGEPRRHGLAQAGIKTVIDKDRRFAVDNYVALGQRREIDWDKEFLTEQEINLLKLRMNRGEDIDLNQLWEGAYEVTPDQNEKGFNWLYNKYKTPRGKERQNHPFGYREQYVLDNFDHFTIDDFMDLSRRGGTSFYTPIYTAWSKEGEDGRRRGFQYYVSGGGINIIG